jgi:hypothetical protein
VSSTAGPANPTGTQAGDLILFTIVKWGGPLTTTLTGSVQGTINPITGNDVSAASITPRVAHIPVIWDGSETFSINMNSGTGHTQACFKSTFRGATTVEWVAAQDMDGTNDFEDVATGASPWTGPTFTVPGNALGVVHFAAADNWTAPSAAAMAEYLAQSNFTTEFGNDMAAVLAVIGATDLPSISSTPTATRRANMGYAKVS